MFRKFIHILLSLLLVVITAGTTFSMHYCGGKLVSVSINKEAKSCCDKPCGKCNNKILHVEIKDQYLIPDQVDNNKIIEPVVLFPVFAITINEILLSEPQTVRIFSDSSPPLPAKIRLSQLQTYLC